MQPMRRQHAAFIKDRLFWLALIAGPVVWAVLAAAGQANAQFPANAKLWLYVVLLYPVLEEIVFRGGLQGALLNKPLFRQGLGKTPLTLANLCTSVVFAAFHLLNQPPLWAASIIAPSLVFGWIRERHDSILPSIVLHIFYNAGFVALFVSA